MSESVSELLRDPLVWGFGGALLAGIGLMAWHDLRAWWRRRALWRELRDRQVVRLDERRERIRAGRVR